MKKKRKSKEFDNDLVIISVTEEHCPNLIVKFSFVKSMPIELSLPKFKSMPFRLIDKLFEKYGVARCFDMNVSMDTPLLTFWYPPNQGRADNPEEVERLADTLFGHVPFHNLDVDGKFRTMDKEERLPVYFGSLFMRAIGQSTGRMDDFRRYMNSVSPIQIPVPGDENDEG